MSTGMKCPHCGQQMVIFSKGNKRNIQTLLGKIPVQVNRLICRPCKYRTTDNCEIAPKGFSYGWDVIEQVVLLKREMSSVKARARIAELGVKLPYSTFEHLYKTFN